METVLVNRHEFVTFVPIAAVALFVIGATVVLILSRPGATRDLVGAVIIVDWMRRRAALRGRPRVAPLEL